MKAIETTGRINKAGNLTLDIPLKDKNQKVKVIVLLSDETNSEEEKTWLQSISKNPAFDFLKDPAEDIYSLESGTSFHD